jgi:hypothetical protein
LDSLLQTAGASILPMHPDPVEGDLGLYFTIDVPDAQASALQDALLQTPGVTAAYMQPPAALP